MIAEGLLWFDDDPRRPLLEKIASAVERYKERTGWQPTVCEAHPTLVEMFNADRARADAAAAKAAARRRPPAPTPPAVTLPPRLRVTPNASMRPNYLLIGIEAGERPRRAASPPATHSAARKAKHTTAAAAPAVAEAPSLPTRAQRERTPRAKAG